MDTKSGAALAIGGSLVVGFATALGSKLPEWAAWTGVGLGLCIMAYYPLQLWRASKRRACIGRLETLRGQGVQLRNDSDSIAEAETAEFVAAVNRFETAVLRELHELDPLEEQGFRTLNQTTTALLNPTNSDHGLHWRCHDERLRRLETIIAKYKDK